MSDFISNTNTASKAPTHLAYHVRTDEGGKGFWTKLVPPALTATAKASASSSKSQRSMAGSRCASPPTRRTNPQPDGRAAKPARPF